MCEADEESFTRAQGLFSGISGQTTKLLTKAHVA